MKKTTTAATSLLSRWKNRDHKNQDASKIEKIPEGISIPLSREQKRLWFLQQLHPKNAFYNYSELYKIQGDIDIEVFEKSIRLIEEKHDILRSTYQVEEGVPAVKIAATPHSKFRYYDFSSYEYAEASQKAEETVRKNASYVFDLASETLLQSTVLKVASNEYLLLLVMHHIITDKWSMKVFRKELAYNYRQLLDKGVVQNEKPEIQYASYAHWQANQPINQAHLEYWKEKLSGDIPTLNLRTDHPKKAQPSYKGTFDKQRYPQETSDAFFELCKKNDTTPYVTMLTLFYILLQKYSGQDDILVGTPITKRDSTSLENLIGFFNDTLVLRSSVQPTLTFKELLREVKNTTLNAFLNKDISFDTLVKELKPERSLSIHPFFQVMFLYHKVPETPEIGEGIHISYEPYDAGVAKFDLTLYISEDQGSLTSLLEYETDLFEPSTIARMHTHFDAILTQVVYNPDVVISEIDLHTSQEMQFYNALEAPVNQADRSYQGIHELIAAQSLKTPNATAVVFKDQNISYRELDKKATQIATYLSREGIQKNDIVGLCVERSQDMIIGLLGILKAGAAYLPLDPEYPLDRIAYVLNNASAKAIVTQETLKEKFTDLPISSLTLEVVQKTELEEGVLPKVDGSDLAYVIYTSGSTGTPKGVPITHDNIISSTLARTDFYRENPKAFLVLSSISFDSSKAGIFWSLCTGGTLVISEKHLEQDINKLVHTIQSNGVSHMLLLPTLYAQILAFGDLDKLDLLKTVIVAGEACPTELVETHFTKLPKIYMYNEYGPTEGTVWGIAHKMSLQDAQKTSVPIGLPINNTQVYLLDEQLQRVPYGTVGELYLGGLGLSKGYLNDELRTAQSFIKSPYDSTGVSFLYKTGDIARYTLEGYVEFLGRKDQQVKVRGYRIELDEIEQSLRKNPAIKQAVVLVEDELDTLDWEALDTEVTEDTLSVLTKYIPKEELEDILTSIEALPEEALDVVVKNLNE